MAVAQVRDYIILEIRHILQKTPQSLLMDWIEIESRMSPALLAQGNK